MNAALPLSDIRVLEIGGYIAAPYASSLLGSLGAEVVKIETPIGGDAFRRGMEDRSPYFAQYNSGKKSVAVDLRNPDGIALVRALARTSDVLLENLRPGKLRSLGLGQDECREGNPGLIYVSVTGVGESGPLSQRPAYDSVGQSLGGLYSLLNDVDDPRLTGTCLADLITGLATATGILAALHGRSNAGKGLTVDTSMFEGVSALTIDAMTQLCELGRAPTRESRHPQAQSFVVSTYDEAKITLHLSSSQKFWHRLAVLIGREDLTEDPEFASYEARVTNYRALREHINPPFAKRTFAEWESLLTEADVPFAAVLDLAQVAEHPQTKLLDLLSATDDGIRLVRAPWRFDGMRPGRSHNTPRVGQNSVEVARTILDDTEVNRLLRAGVLTQATLA